MKKAIQMIGGIGRIGGAYNTFKRRNEKQFLGGGEVLAVPQYLIGEIKFIFWDN